MATFTKSAEDIFAPFEPGGAPRGADMAEVQTGGMEVEDQIGQGGSGGGNAWNIQAVSYTHLDVYKRQSRDIDHVQITVAETVGLEQRAGYYDKSGHMRDMVQNHLMQLLTLFAIEPPNMLEAGAVREEKIKVLKALRPIVCLLYTSRCV